MRVLRALPDLFRVQFAQVVAYRAEFVIWMLTATLPLIMLALWSSVASDGAVAGMNQDDLARYFVVTLVIRQLTSIWLVWTFGFEVRTGKLSARLLKPMNPLWLDAAGILSALPLRLLVLIPLVAGVIWWRPGLLFVPDPTALLLAIPALLVAWLLHFAIQVCFSLTAFWIDKADSLFMVFFAFFAFFSGYVAPLALFPEWSQTALNVLPFRAMHAAPTELIAGMSDASTAGVDLAVGVGWLLAFTLLGRWLWTAGLKRYGAFGG
ncbi:MAG: ABC transporter permease [Myxococcota bacterium]